ncbi:MAG TPA: MFS transporter [Actinospica sp.]|nr:MFS transporter [Actinospica sp.]
MSDDRYKWVALSNTTLGMFMAVVDASIVIISLPAIFRGIHLDPFGPGNISYLLWIIMGYLLVTAVLVVTLGRLGDILGRVRIYNLGFVVFTLASVALSFDPAHGAGGALWLIIWRLVQAVGGAMLMANSAAIITDAFPAEQRGMALGVNQIAALAGQFIGLVLGGVLSVWDWRAVFWINVPFGIFGTIWAYRSLREVGERHEAKIDWWGNLTFAGGCAMLLAAITYGIQPYGGHSMGWTSPYVLGGLIGGVLLLVLFGFIEQRVPQPMFRLSLFRNRAFAAGNAAALLASIARGGMQFMLIIWLQGIWLPLHGYDYADTPLWAGIFLLPLTAGFLLAGPLSGYLSDRYGVFYFTTGGLTLFAFSFIGLLLLPLNFPYWAFALLIMLNGFGSGMFSAPNTSAIMSSVPASDRGAASGMRSTFQNSGMSLSIGVFFSLLIAGLAGQLPGALASGLTAQGVPAAAAQHAAQLPAVSTVFAAFLGANPMQTLLGPTGVLSTLSPHAQATITGKTFFPNLISGPFHHGLTIVFGVAAAMALLAATASMLRGASPVATDSPAGSPRPEPASKR